MNITYIQDLENPDLQIMILIFCYTIKISKDSLTRLKDTNKSKIF